MSSEEIIAKALNYSEVRFGIPPLFTAEELVHGNVDQKSLMLYTSLFINYDEKVQSKFVDEYR